MIHRNNQMPTRRHAMFGAVLCCVLWACTPVSTTAFAADSVSPFVAGFERFARHEAIDAASGGRLLVSELSCTACHAVSQNSLQAKRGPVLDGVADRVSPEWLQQFLLSPSEAKPGTTMPDMLAALTHDDRQAAAKALAAFLATLHKPFPEIKGSGINPVPLEFWDRGNFQRGKQLYHNVGCVACHAADPDFAVVEIAQSPIDQSLNQLDADEIAELGLEHVARKVESIPLPNVASKYTPIGLTHFLLNPEHVRPSGRMPNFGFGAVEAADVAAYLLQRQTTDIQDAAFRTAGDSSVLSDSESVIEAGRQLFASLGCINCHSVTDFKGSNVVAKPLAMLDFESRKNCVGSAVEGIPHFPIDKVQRQMLQQTAASAVRNKLNSRDELQARLLQSNCFACHDRDKLGGIGRFRRPYFETVANVDIGDEGRLPPALTGIGKKLTVASMKSVLAGKTAIRPHMHIRMPVFPTAATKELPELFAAADSIGSQPTEAAVFGNFKSLATEGRALMDAGCVQCHTFKGETLPGTVGVDLAGVTDRVNPKWFYDFLHNPSLLKERTRMPTFFPNGISQNKDILNGDTRKQISAMWAYLKDLDRQLVPEKILVARNQDYELVPTDRPIVLRTFMPEAGTHAIAVGFPANIHFAFDAEKIRLAQAWRGRFLDAQGTWFVRFTPPANPLGDHLAVFADSVPFASLIDAKQVWPADAGAAGYRFKGYRLDAGGVPTFLYQFGNYDVEDRIQPGKQLETQQILTRQFKVVPRESSVAEDRSLWMRVHQGKELKLTKSNSCTNDAGVVVTVVKGVDGAAELRRTAAKAEWIFPLPKTGELQIEVQYSW
ncbi:MAG: c-type cytochrome [Fuerstiella sp.]